MNHRSKAQKEAWKKLSAHQRKLLMSHLPDDLEREMNLRSSILTACSNVYGPYQWDATLALLAEGEADTVDRPKPSDYEPDGASIREIADECKVSTARVHHILHAAYGKLRCKKIMQELFYGEVPEENMVSPLDEPVHYYPHLIEEAIKRAKRAG